MAADQIVEEIHDVATPGVDRAGSHEAVRLLRRPAIPHRPRLPSNRCRGNLGADRLDRAVFRQPNHQLIVAGLHLVSKLPNPKSEGDAKLT